MCTCLSVSRKPKKIMVEVWGGSDLALSLHLKLNPRTPKICRRDTGMAYREKKKQTRKGDERCLKGSLSVDERQL